MGGRIPTHDARFVRAPDDSCRFVRAESAGVSLICAGWLAALARLAVKIDVQMSTATHCVGMGTGTDLGTSFGAGWSIPEVSQSSWLSFEPDEPKGAVQ